jgi:23S rRNA maturation mini-RNase III
VINSNKNQKIVINKKKITPSNRLNLDYFDLILSFVGGAVFSLIIIKLLSISKNRFKLPHNLYERLLPYADNGQIKTILEKLYNKQKLSKEEKEFIKNFLKNNN